MGWKETWSPKETEKYMNALANSFTLHFDKELSKKDRVTSFAPFSTFDSVSNSHFQGNVLLGSPYTHTPPHT